MKILKCFLPLVAIGVLSTTRLCATFESYKVEVTYVPALSPALLMDGVTNGKVMFAISVDADGRLSDVLTLGYTHPALVAPCRDALNEWKFTPAKIDGHPVGVQSELEISYNAQGVVVSRLAVTNLEREMDRMFGPHMTFQKRAARDLDAAPSLVSKPAPQYASQAATDGVKGKVWVHFYIDETGAVRMPAVEGEAHPYLSEMAVSAVKNWRFTPPTARGKPVLIAARQEFDFSR